MKHLLSIVAVSLLLAACSKPATSMDNGVSVSSQVTSTSYSLPADPQHGALTHLAIGPINGVAPVLANGTAVVWMFEDGTGRISINVNIAAATAGQVYIGWLQDDSGKGAEKLGTLTNTRGDVRHSLRIEAQKDYKRYTNLIVTLESSEGVSMPSKIVANGILKETAR